MNKQFFQQKFTKYLKDWQKEQKRKGLKSSQYEFARQVKGLREKRTGEKCPVTDKYVSQWVHGKWVPVEYFPEIAEVLGISVESLYPSTHNEQYENESSFITEIGKNHVEFANRIGLDLGLVDTLSRITKYDQDFPLYAPIKKGTWDDEEERRIYDREVEFADSAEIDHKLQFLQLNRDGKRITFSRYDLAFLKEVQDNVIDYVEYLFYKRRKEMEVEREKFNQDLIEVKVDGVPVEGSEKQRYINESNQKPVSFDSAEDFDREHGRLQEELSNKSGQSVEISYRAITEEFLYEHDRFAKVVLEDAKEHGRPRYKGDRRKATQKDIDDFFGKGERHGNSKGENK